jgi:hypothetical protein
MAQYVKDALRVRCYPKLSFGNAFRPGTSGKAMLAIFLATLAMLAVGIVIVMLGQR